MTSELFVTKIDCYNPYLSLLRFGDIEREFYSQRRQVCNSRALASLHADKADFNRSES